MNDTKKRLKMRILLNARNHAIDSTVAELQAQISELLSEKQKNTEQIDELVADDSQMGGA